MVLVRDAKRKTTKFWAKSETSMPPFTLCVQTLLYKKFVFPKTPPPPVWKIWKFIKFSLWLSSTIIVSDSDLWLQIRINEHNN